MMLWLRKFQVLALLAIGITFVSCAAAQAQSKFPASEWMKKDTRFKLGVMKEFIAEAKRNGVVMRFSPEYYVKEVDSTIENAIRNHDEKGLTTAVGIMIHTIAAMDGDWDNGESKLVHARKWLGPANFEALKEMFPQKYARLLEERREDPDPWKHLGYSGNLLIHYDAASLSYVSKSVVRVWARTQYLDAQEGLKDLKERGVHKRDYEKYAHDLYLYKIDCANDTFAVLTDYRYRKDGTLIEAFDFPDRWATISPRSVIDMLSRRVCTEARETEEKAN